VPSWRSTFSAHRQSQVNTQALTPPRNSRHGTRKLACASLVYIRRHSSLGPLVAISFSLTRSTTFVTTLSKSLLQPFLLRGPSEQIVPLLPLFFRYAHRPCSRSLATTHSGLKMGYDKQASLLLRYSGTANPGRPYLYDPSKGLACWATPTCSKDWDLPDVSSACLRSSTSDL
jgi:hypothetical protein